MGYKDDSIDWLKMAAEALTRRRKLNTPWPPTNNCMGCGNSPTSKISAVLCDGCIKKAYDVLEQMEK
jgi:hypothetical protein